MVNLKEFLLNNVGAEDVGCYALVSYNGKKEAIWFSNFCNLNKDGEVFFLESPCELDKICEVGLNIDEFCKEYMKGIDLMEGATEGESEKDYIENFVKPMIVDGFLYEIENFQVAPYLPDEVESIEIITERECLEWLLSNLNVLK